MALIVPDHTDKAYIEGMCTVLLQRMGFRQCGVLQVSLGPASDEMFSLTIFLQESLCATFGAGLSSACIVDIGAERTSVACVDDGLLLGETRYVSPCRKDTHLNSCAPQAYIAFRPRRRHIILHRPFAPSIFSLS